MRKVSSHGPRVSGASQGAHHRRNEQRGEPEGFPAEGDLDERLLWIGEDDRGVALEIIGVEQPDYLLIIHVMPYSYRRK